MNVEHFSLTGIFIFCIIYLYLFAVVCRTDPIFAFSRKIGGNGIPLLKFSEELIMKKIAAAFLALFSAISLFSGCSISVHDEPCGIENVYLPSNAEKYGKYAHIGSTAETVMTASLAKNEGEGMQFVLKPDEEAKNVRVTMTDLTLNGGSDVMEDVTLYYQHYIYCGSDYSKLKTAGWYPDMLIPISGDCSDLNGIDVEANANQGFWITVWSRKDQTPGLYTAEVTVEYDGAEPIKIPVEVTVWDFEIPEEHSFDAAYSLGWFSGSVSYEEAYEYLLRYRTNGSIVPAVRGKNLSADESAKAAAEYIESHPGVSCFMPSMHTKEYFDALEKYGILDKCYTYIFDEPADTYEQNKTMSDRFKSIHNMNANVKNMLTTASRDAVTDVDIWCGIWSDHDCDELTVRDRISEGYEMWWYGCVSPKNPYPTYHIMDELISSRIVHWMQKDWGITGNLLWVTDMNRRCDLGYNGAQYGSADRDIYTQPYVFYNSETGDDCVGAAGDGYLICYAREGDGVVNRNMILPTIRLESVRDGSEDYEYLCILEKKISALFEKWGVSDITVDEYMDTYYDAVYNSMADFERDPEYMIKMRERIAHDIMNADCAIAVEAFPTYENPNQRCVTVYAENGSSVSVDGKELSETDCGSYSVYTAVYDMNTLFDRTEITVTVNGEEYNRVLKSVEDIELMEEVRAKIRSDVEQLGLSMSGKEASLIYEKNTFVSYVYPKLGSLGAQLAQNGSDYVIKRYISVNRDYAEEVKKCIASDMRNTIPLVITNEPTDVVGQPTCETLTLYVPCGSTVKVNGAEAELIAAEATYSVYTAQIDVGTDSRYFYDVEVTSGGETQTWRKVILHTVQETVSIFDINSENLAAALAKDSKNADAVYEVIEYEGSPAVKVTIDEVHTFTVPSSLIPVKNLTDYSMLTVDLVCLSENSEGFDIQAVSSVSGSVVDIATAEKDFDGYVYGNFPAGARRNKVSRLTLMADMESYYNYAPGGTYIIKGIYAVKETVDIAKEK